MYDAIGYGVYIIYDDANIERSMVVVEVVVHITVLSDSVYVV